MVEMQKEVKMFERKTGEKIENYIARFNALEMKLRNKAPVEETSKLR